MRKRGNDNYTTELLSKMAFTFRWLWGRHNWNT